MSKKAKKKKSSHKEIRIECEGAEVVDINDVTLMQGDLKALNEDNHARLREEIIRGGFSEPLVLWKKKGTKYVIAGHQRATVLRALANEGYKIPPIPASTVEAKDEREAREKLLGLASQYGEVDEDGLAAFLKKTKMETEEAATRFRFTEVNVELLGIEPNDVPPPPITGEDNRTKSIIVYYETDSERMKIANMLDVDAEKVVHRMDGQEE